MRPFIFLRTNLHDGPAMRGAALCSLGGVLLMGCGGLTALVLFVVAAFRILFGGFGSGAGTLFTAFAIGLVAQLLGTALLRLGAHFMRRSLSAVPAAPAGSPGRRGVTIEGEVVERTDGDAPR